MPVVTIQHVLTLRNTWVSFNHIPNGLMEPWIIEAEWRQTIIWTNAGLLLIGPWEQISVIFESK